MADTSLHTDDLRQRALEYALHGWPVFPLQVKGKKPANDHGFKEATQDEQQVREWWQRPYNLGTPTGVRSGLYVIDVDGAEGYESLKRLEAQYGTLPETLSVKTNKGQHFYFQMPADFDLRNSAGKLGRRIDTRGNGGYVVLPPSVHPEGHIYAWEMDPFSTELAHLPQWAINLLMATAPIAAAPAAPTRTEQERRYVSGALDSACAKVEHAHEGTRNDTLYREAFSIGTLVGGGYLSRGEAELRLSEAASRSGLPVDEIKRSLKSGLDGGDLKPRDLSGKLQETQATQSNNDHPNGYELIIEQAPPVFETNDVGNARRLVYRHGARIRYCHNFKKWFIWDARRWAIDETEQIMRMAKETARSILLEAAATEDDNTRKGLTKWSHNSHSKARLDAMIALATSEEGIPVTPAQLDKDTMLFNCLSGTLDLRTGQLRPHHSADLITKIAMVEYQPDAMAPTWEAFLDRIFDGNQNIMDFMRRIVGYSMTGSTVEQCLFILHGNGANGKSTFLEACRALLGDYAQQTPAELLMPKKHDNSANNGGQARLKGARFVSAVESESGAKIAESLVKQMTGGDQITARHLFGDFFEFKPQFKLFLGTNHRPNIRGTDHGIWRRIRLIPFETTIPPEERDPKLGEKLQAELPGILSWALQGCLEWQANGLGVPQEVVAATEDYRAESDSFGKFLSDTCATGETFQVATGDLYDRYTIWCDEAGEDPKSKKWVGTQLKERGFKDAKGAQGLRKWIGLKLQMSNEVANGGTVFPKVFSSPKSHEAHRRKHATSCHLDDGNDDLNLSELKAIML